MGIVRLIDNEDSKHTFGFIRIGETFKYDDELYVKISKDETPFNALNLQTSVTKYIDSHEQVTVVDVEVKIIGAHRIGN